MKSLSTLGIPRIREHIPLTLALVIDAVAAGIAAPIFLLYLVEVAEMPVSRAGTILAVASLLALGMPAVVVALISRLGPRLMLIWAQLIQGCAFGGLMVTDPHPWMLAALVTLAAIGQRMFWSSVFPFIAEAAIAVDEPSSAPRWFAFAGMTQAAGMACGAAVVGVLLLLNGDAPFYAALSSSCALFFASAIFLALQRSNHSNRTAQLPMRPQTWQALRDRPYMAFTIVNIVFALCTVSLALGLSVYVTLALGLPRATVAPILMIVTVLNVTCQGLVVRLVERRSAATSIALAATFWMLWGIVMASLVHIPHRLRLPLLVVATLLFSAAQLLHAPISNSLAAAAAPRERRSEYLALFQYSFAIAGVVAPALFGWLFAVGPAIPYAVLAGLAGFAAIAMLQLRPQLATRMPIHSKE